MDMHCTRRTPIAGQQSGSIVVIILIIMLFLTTMLFGAILLANENMNRAWQRLMLLQAQYAAESGADYAITTLNNVNSSYTGTGSSPANDVTVLSNSMYKATFSITVSTSGSTATITSTGKVYKPKTAATAAYTRKVRVTAQQTAGSTASGMMGTNTIVVDSSVKNVNATNIFVNSFFKANKNTTNINFSKMTVGGKDSSTGTSNCSISGSGALNNYPSSSKATIDVAYNNCITPPGNTSNSNFNVTANDNNINTIQSLYIPWSQYMDNSYSNSPSGCADWSGSGTITIPSTGNAKKTHYPDTGSGVASTCGTSGVLALGTNQYNFNDNIHIRADLCSYSTQCYPTFNNTSGSIKFIFVEGNAYFKGVKTASGSAPVVIEAFGANSANIPSSRCNGVSASIYVGNNGSNGTNAPALYLLTKNNICFDQSKFDANPALGGLGGQNLYLSTNSGTPFDLYLNTSFPTSSIPINLAWRATGYERL